MRLYSHLSNKLINILQFKCPRLQNTTQNSGFGNRVLFGVLERSIHTDNLYYFIKCLEMPYFDDVWVFCVLVMSTSSIKMEFDMNICSRLMTTVV